MFKRLGENKLSKKTWITILGTPLALILLMLLLSFIVRLGK